jgi:hypothetical protein
VRDVQEETKMEPPASKKHKDKESLDESRLTDEVKKPSKAINRAPIGSLTNNPEWTGIINELGQASQSHLLS